MKVKRVYDHLMEPFDLKEIQAKSILSPSKLKSVDYDYSCNPYVGCRFSCVYCYASFMARMVGKKTSDWGKFVFVKMNAPELIGKEINKLKDNGRGKIIWFSSVTDPYQGVEKKYRLTHKCLRVLLDHKFQGTVSILTKSNLILGDIDILKKLPSVDVGMTITSTDDAISRYFEKFAPPASVRLNTLKELTQSKLPTYAFIGPLLPHFVANPSSLNKLFQSVYDTGVKEIYIEYLNLSPYIRSRLKYELKDLDAGIWNTFYNSQSNDYRKELDRLVYGLVKKYGFKLRMGNTLFHKEMS